MFPLATPESDDPASVALLPDGRVRAMLKIQEGCRADCAYCIVPLVRSAVTSVPPDVVIRDINARVSEGYREAVLTGTEIGAYRSNGHSLATLVRRIISETVIDRLRLSSLQPQEITADLLSLWSDSRLCPHFHLALQSGCDSTLQRMRRRYSIDQFTAALRRIRQALPDAAVTTDVIVGFPGESDSDFERSLEFCEQAGFAAIHVFPFSGRPGTEAARMEGLPPAAERLRRSRRFLTMAGRARIAFRQTFIGRTVAVLWEKETAPGSGIYTGLTGNYLRVIAPASTSLTNQIRPVRLTGISGDAISGRLA